MARTGNRRGGQRVEIYREEHSVIARYADRLIDIPRQYLCLTTLREGARIVALPDYRGVRIDVLDLSTLSTTGTFKDWVAAIAVAGAIARQQRVVLAQSSGNTGNAIARYASNAGIRCVILYPPPSRRRILPGLARLPGVEFIEIDAPEEQIKRVLADCSRQLEIPTIPSLHCQYEGNKLRAYLLHDAAAASGRRWDWHVQALSSAYGPLGFYRGVSEIQHRNPSITATPRFLGIQQEAVSPYVSALTGTPTQTNAPMIEPTLFRKTLTPALMNQMRHMCATSNGTVRLLTNTSYLALEQHTIHMLNTAGIAITLDSDGQPRERAGLYSLAGACDAIDHGLIPPGDQALIVYTGGSGPSAPLFYPRFRTQASALTSAVSHALTTTSGQALLTEGHRPCCTPI
ncbi:MAG TPA: pyridoxal-phosphate dependent enzyme [Pseudonocardiaceae bacterium]|nr:pyridoxal-phosphate dependent enzyme [Pseudonocardiaceae bacterium]